MKKISLLTLGLLCLIITGCTSKEVREASTLDNFTTVTTNNGFIIYDKLDDYKNEKVDYITGALVATKDDIEIEMVTYDSENSAKKTMTEHVATFKTMRSPGMTGSAEKGKNFEKHTLISNGYYTVTSRIEDTLIFSKTPLNNKEQVEKIFNDLGY